MTDRALVIAAAERILNLQPRTGIPNDATPFYSEASFPGGDTIFLWSVVDYMWVCRHWNPTASLADAWELVVALRDRNDPAVWDGFCEEFCEDGSYTWFFERCTDPARTITVCALEAVGVDTR